MSDEVLDGLARKLSQWIERRFGVTGAVPRSDGYASGDIYGSASSSDTIKVSFVRPDNGKELSVYFDRTYHLDSGQLDGWELIVTGADAADQPALIEMFHPRDHAKEMVQNELRYPKYRFDGVEGRFPGA